MISIHNGPSKWALMLAFFDPTPTSGEPRVVTFLSEDGNEVEVVIVTLKRSSFSDSVFTFAGWIKKGNIPDVLSNKYVTGTYDVHSRKGSLQASYDTNAGLPRI
jgi:hypothetical protein